MAESEKTSEANVKAGIAHFDQTVRVLVGAAAVPFTVHKDLLISKSKFFQAALNGRWNESLRKEVRLPEEGLGPFREFAHWVYFNDLTNRDGNEQENWEALLNAWILGDKLMCTSFKNAIMEALVARSRLYKFLPNAGLIKIVCEKTTSESMLRKFLIDYNALRLKPLAESFMPYCEQLPPEFVIQAFRASLQLWDATATTRTKSSPALLVASKYVENDDAVSQDQNATV